MGERPYLRADARRRQLLDAASRLFDRGGFTAITVSAVAAEAGTSRRLVYDHFSDLGDLYAAFFEDRVGRAAEAIDQARTGAAPDRSFEAAVRALIAVPPLDLRAIQLVIADSSTPELSGARAALRTHLESRWLPLLGSLGVDLAVARALLWVLAGSFVTIADLVQRNDLPSSAGVDLAAAIAATLPRTAEHLARRPTTASETP